MIHPVASVGTRAGVVSVNSTADHVNDVARLLHDLGDQYAAGTLDDADLLGALTAVQKRVEWARLEPSTTSTRTTAVHVGLDVGEVARRTGMSRDWVYREARAGRLPFARKHGRRIVFDEAGLQRWLERRHPLTPTP